MTRSKNRSLTTLVTLFTFCLSMIPLTAFAEEPPAKPTVQVDAPVTVDVEVKPPRVVVKPTSVVVKPTPVTVRPNIHVAPTPVEFNPEFRPTVLPAPVVIQPAPRFEIEKQWWFWTAVVVVVGGVTVAGVCGGGYCGGGSTSVSFH